jgi:hypothetical protein
LIDAVFDKIENEFCNTSELVNIITGATNLGIPKMVYDKANEENIRLGKRFNLVGVMAKEGYEYELYPCDIIYAYGKNFGDESKEFISIPIKKRSFYIFCKEDINRICEKCYFNFGSFIWYILQFTSICSTC